MWALVDIKTRDKIIDTSYYYGNFYGDENIDDVDDNNEEIQEIPFSVYTKNFIKLNMWN